MYRASLEPLTNYLEGIYTRIIKTEFGLPLKFHFNLGEKEDRLMEAQTHQIYVQIGAESPDEIRKNILGLDPDPDKPVPRFVHTNYAPLPVEMIGKYIPYMLLPPEYAGDYQRRGTPSLPMTTVRYEPKLNPDGSPPDFAQRSNQAAQQALDDAEHQAEEQLNQGVEKATEPSDGAVLTELKRWKQNSKRRVKKGRATRQFESDILPDHIHDQVWDKLQSATTTEEVERAFRGSFFW